MLGFLPAALPLHRFSFSSPLQGAGQAQRGILTPAQGEERAPGDAASSHQLSKAAWPGKEREDKEGGPGPREQGEAARGLT